MKIKDRLLSRSFSIFTFMEQLPDFIQVQIDRSEQKEKPLELIRREYPQLPDFIEQQRDEYEKRK